MLTLRMQCVASQVDLGQQERRVVSKAEAEEFGRLNGLKYFETSAVRSCI